MNDNEKTNASKRNSAEYINNVPIMARPTRQDVDLFDPREFKEPPKSKAAPVLAITIGIVLLIAVAVAIAIGIATLVSSDSGNTVKMKTGFKYFVLLQTFNEPDSRSKAKAVLNQLEAAGETMVVLLGRSEPGSDTLLTLAFFRPGEEEFLDSKMDYYKSQFPDMQVRPMKDDEE